MKTIAAYSPLGLPVLPEVNWSNARSFEDAESSGPVVLFWIALLGAVVVEGAIGMILLLLFKPNMLDETGGFCGEGDAAALRRFPLVFTHVRPCGHV